MKTCTLSCVFLIGIATSTTTLADLTFTASPGYAAETVWSGSDVAHFTPGGDGFFVYGTAPDSGQYRNVVRYYDGEETRVIAASPAFGADQYFPDAITAVGNSVYWAHVQSYTSGSAANVYKTIFDGQDWNTTQILDESAGINVYSLSTNGDGVFGVGVGSSGTNVAFYFDSDDQYEVFAEIPEYSGGSGFDPAGNFYATATDASFTNHAYAFTASQVSDRLDGTQPTPYSAGDATADYIVPGNASSVMESDGAALFGSQYNTTYNGTNPFAYDLGTGTAQTLGVLSGVDTPVTTDMYYHDGATYFLGKDGWTNGATANIYRLVPEPSAAIALTLLLLVRRRTS